MPSDLLLVDFPSRSAVPIDWQVVNDGVMGGLSQGHFQMEEDGFATFTGEVSLANNGGFTMVQGHFSSLDPSGYSRFLIRLKGDGKRYQFRVKSRDQDRHSYGAHFPTSGDWETIEISTDRLAPVFRGRKLAIPAYPGEQLEQVAFLIGNKRAETFRLQIDWIKLQ